MTAFGYTLVTEQSAPRELVLYAIAPERVGFEFDVSSDHYSPGLVAQGHAPYAWSALGAVAQATERVELASGILASVDAGFTDVALVQVGDAHQQDFLDTAARPLLEKLRRAG